MRYLVECLGHSAFILEFCIACDIILICPSVYVFQYNASGFLPIHQCNVDIFVRVSDARWK